MAISKVNPKKKRTRKGDRMSQQPVEAPPLQQAVTPAAQQPGVAPAPPIPPTQQQPVVAPAPPTQPVVPPQGQPRGAEEIQRMRDELGGAAAGFRPLTEPEMQTTFQGLRDRETAAREELLLPPDEYGVRRTPEEQGEFVSDVETRTGEMMEGAPSDADIEARNLARMRKGQREEPVVLDKDEDWTRESVQGRMQEAENVPSAGQRQFLENQRYAAEQEAPNVVSPERMKEVEREVEDRKFSRYEKQSADYEASGFEGTQEEYEQNIKDTRGYDRAIEQHDIPSDMSLEEFVTQREEGFVQQKADYRAGREADKIEHSERLAKKRTARDEKDQRRRAQTEAGAKARRMGIRQGTPEFSEFMEKELITDTQRADRLALTRAEHGDTIGVAELGLKGTEATVEGQISVTELLGANRITELGALGINEQALQELQNKGIKIGTKSNEEIQRLIGEQQQTGLETQIEGQQTGLETQIAGEQTGLETQIAGEQTGLETKIAGEQTGLETQIAATQKSLETSLAANEAIEARNDATANKQLDSLQKLEQGKLDLAGFQIELDAMLNLENATADRIAQFLVAGAAVMTPDMMSEGLARLAQMDGGEAFVDTVQSHMRPGESLSGLGETAREEKIEEQEVARVEASKTSQQGRIVFNTPEEAEKWDNDITSISADKTGAIAVLSDIPLWGGGADYYGKAELALTQLEDIRTKLVNMPPDEMQAAALHILNNTDIEDLDTWFDVGGVDPKFDYVTSARRGYLETLRNLARGNKMASNQYQDGMSKLNLNIK